MGESILKEKQYHVIKITFSQAGGGEDHQDVFLYWINKSNFRIDYLAYSYHTKEAGVRFREATNARSINGILFQDYINYKPKTEDIALAELEKLFLSDELEKLSEINLENIVFESGVNLSKLSK